ncbi:LOW QUALITY PROTEIN: hypothetical protein PanWU01x14_340150 [Parasponia andersonii]|uniref:Uncharacterized protein n=1 Tax=Parasponia andersonii TaxID=3476 RepID=A0A2P5AEJ7_PARAD|nr:LOW QUALITY PROTEIN: hypothetical protein PanWU01x14_340150 [Parasponia andersonii]
MTRSTDQMISNPEWSISKSAFCSVKYW